MSRISNELAGQIAYKLTEASRLEVEQLHTDYRELATSLYEEQTPDDVKKAKKNNPDWIETNTSIRADGNGFNHEYISTERPVISKNSGNSPLKMTNPVANQLFKAKVKWEKAKKKYEDLKAETKSALLALKTFNNIRKELPQAAPFLPPPMSNALVVNFTSLKKKLTSQPDIKEVAAT